MMKFRNEKHKSTSVIIYVLIVFFSFFCFSAFSAVKQKEHQRYCYAISFLEPFKQKSFLMIIIYFNWKFLEVQCYVQVYIFLLL